MDSCGPDLSIIYNQYISGLKIFPNIRKDGVLNFTVIAVYYQQSGSIALQRSRVACVA